MSITSSDINVLLVDENTAEARLIMEVFRRYQIRNKLLHLKNSDDALDYLNKKGKYKNCKNPSLILLNLNLSKRDGGELLKIIKRDEELKIIPVIMLVDSSYEKYIIDSYKNCANAVIIKPDDYDGFEELILSLEDFWVNKTKLPEF